MILEKEMENAIIDNPERYIGEKGLKLICQQYRIGNYIFDLLYEDRHGSKLIVEIQRGTLDRNHTYKILDYYDEYKESNPHEFVELMVIANKITDERKRRLNSWGVTWKEIPTASFYKIQKNPEEIDKVRTKGKLVKDKGINIFSLDVENYDFSNPIFTPQMLQRNQTNLIRLLLLKNEPNAKIVELLAYYYKRPISWAKSRYNIYQFTKDKGYGIRGTGKRKDGSMGHSDKKLLELKRVYIDELSKENS